MILKAFRVHRKTYLFLVAFLSGETRKRPKEYLCTANALKLFKSAENGLKTENVFMFTFFTVAGGSFLDKDAGKNSTENTN
jgi:hypothetical protein